MVSMPLTQMVKTLIHVPLRNSLILA